MQLLQLLLFLLVGIFATATVLIQNPLRQALVFSVYGTLMAVLLVVLQAGDVALSELAVGTAAIPLMLLVTLASVRETTPQKLSSYGRILMTWIGVALLGFFLIQSIIQLPGFGNYPGPYGDMINGSAPYQRHVTNAVTSVNFDYRALDTLGEEFILFGAVAGISLLLRGNRGESPEAAPEGVRPFSEARSEAVRWISFSLIAIINLFGSYIVIHGPLSPGGGFQGGAILGTASLLVYIAIGYRAYRRSTPKRWIEFAEAVGAGSYVLVGIGGLLQAGAFLQNVLPLGSMGSWLAGGTIPLINFAVGLEVAAGFALLFAEFLEETRACAQEDLS